MSGKLTSKFSFAFDGIIWNMLLDDQAKYLILEIRENDLHQVSFTTIALDKGEVIWDGLTFDENWWVGMTAIHNDVLLLHTYEDNTDPEPKGLMAFHVQNKEVLWQEKLFRYIKVLDGQVWGYSIEDEEKRYKAIALQDGLSKELEEAQVLSGINAVSANTGKGFSALYPVHYHEGTEYFATCSTFIHNRFTRAAVSAMDYLELDEGIIISYYTRKGEELDNFLLVMDPEGKELLHESIQKNITTVGLDTFFIVKNQLIFVKDKNEIYSFAFR